MKRDVAALLLPGLLIVRFLSLGLLRAESV